MDFPQFFLAVVVAVTAICAIGGVIASQMAVLANDAPTYARTIEGKVDGVHTYASRQLGGIASRMGYGAAPAQGAKPTSAAPPFVPLLPKTGASPLPVEVHEPDPSPFELARRYLSPMISPLGTIAIILVVTIFLLLQRDDLRDRIIRMAGSRDMRRTTVALDDGCRRLSRYFVTQLGINTAFGIVIGIGLFMIGLPSPLLWGVMAGVLRFVPYVGALVAALLPMALAAAVDPGWSMVLWTGGLFFVVEVLAGQMVEPRLHGNSTGLSPISIVVAAIFWSWLWGPIGLILSTPLTLCLVVLGRHVNQLEFLDVLLGDRPALTPVEAFYHRMLTGDPDEARDHAEILLKERSLMSYYDEVALPGLELAAIDAQRGTITTEQLGRMRDTINELVEDLVVHLDGQPKGGPAMDSDDGEPPPEVPPEAINLAHIVLPPIWRGPTPVLCVAGLGPLDEAAASMLAQLLSKHGVGSRIAPHDAVARGSISSLDMEGVAVVCVSYLDISERQAHLRYLLQRIRQRQPGTPLVVGLWPNDDPAMPDERARAALGADHYMRTLKDAVEVCISLVKESAVVGSVDRSA